MIRKEELVLTNDWDKTFPKSEKVDHSKVTFVNRYHAGGGYVWGDKVIGDPNMVREGPKPSKRLFPRRVKS